MYILLLWGGSFCIYQLSPFDRMSFNATISLLILCFKDLSNVDNGVLKIPYNECVAVDIFPVVLQDFSIVSGCSSVGRIYVYQSFTFLIDYSLKYYVVTFFVSFYGLCFEGHKLSILAMSILSYISIATPALFSCPFAWNIFIIPSLSVCVGLLLWDGSLVDSMYVGHVFLSIQLSYVFWLEHLIHLHLRLSLTGT